MAVMINNIEEATPQQWAPSQADILYEAVVEGDITRMLAIFQDTSNIEKSGLLCAVQDIIILTLPII